MLLMDIEKEIQPLPRSEKLQLMQRLAAMLKEEDSPKIADRSVEAQPSDFQPDLQNVEMIQAAAQEPYWDLYDADEAAQALWAAKHSDLPAL
jgi:hypothetical protein